MFGKLCGSVSRISSPAMTVTTSVTTAAPIHAPRRGLRVMRSSSASILRWIPNGTMNPLVGCESAGADGRVPDLRLASPEDPLPTLGILRHRHRPWQRPRGDIVVRSAATVRLACQRIDAIVMLFLTHPLQAQGVGCAGRSARSDQARWKRSPSSPATANRAARPHTSRGLWRSIRLLLSAGPRYGITFDRCRCLGGGYATPAMVAESHPVTHPQ